MAETAGNQELCRLRLEGSGERSQTRPRMDPAEPGRAPAPNQRPWFLPITKASW